MLVLSIIFLYIICYELLLKLGQHLLFGFKLIKLLGNFYYGNWMVDFSFNFCVDPYCWAFTEVDSCN